MKKSVVIFNPLPMETTMASSSLGLPYGPLYLSESLDRHGYEPHIVYDDNDKAIQRAKQLITEDTLCVGISTMSGTQLYNAISIAKQIKELYPQLPVVWGGVHVTSLPKQTLESDLVDIIVWGEGEEVFPVVLEAIQTNNIRSLANLPGIGIKLDGIPIVGPNSGYTVLKNRIFKLPYHLLNMNRHYRKLIIGPEREYPIWTSRGCPYGCSFCNNSNSIWPNTKMRYHSLDHIVHDVSVLTREYGADCITFADEGFLQSEKKFIEILQAIRDDGIFVKYRFSARIDQLLRLKTETWEIMKDYGVIGITTAPESGSQKILDYMGKGITLDQIYAVDAIMSKYKFFKAFNFLICTPSETKDDLKATLKLILDLTNTSTYCPYPLGDLNKFIPLPGTKLFEDAVCKGLVSPKKLEDWAHFDFENITETRGHVRPWLLNSDFDFINKASKLVEELNLEFTGYGSNMARINDLKAEIARLIERG